MGSNPTKLNVRQSSSLDILSPKVDENLPIKTYQWWLDAIVTDNDNLVRTTLEKKDHIYIKQILLNGYFEFPVSEVVLHDDLSQKYAVCKPWFLAAVFGAEKTLAIFIENGVNIQQRDNIGNNVFHSLVMTAHLSPKKENQLQRVYVVLTQILPLPELKVALMAENKLGLRPLEYASHLATYNLFLTIMCTRDVYLIKEWAEGIYIKRWYDVTDYEQDSKRVKRMYDPLRFLTLLDSQHLSDESTNILFNSTIIKTWIKAKLDKQKPSLWLVLIMKLVYIFIFIIMDIGTFVTLSTSYKTPNSNISSAYCYDISSIRFSPTTNLALAVTIICICLCSLTTVFRYFIISKREQIKYHWELKFLTREKQPILRTYFSTLVSQIGHMGTMTLSILVILRYCGYGSFNASFVNIVHIMTSLCIVWALLVSLQMFESIGHYILMIQTIIVDAIPFYLLGMIIASAFLSSFMYIMNNLEDVQCSLYFSSLIETLYSLHKIMFGLVNLENYDVKYRLGLVVTHSLYIITTNMFLINIFIAIFTDTVALISKHKHIFLSVNNLILIYQNNILFYNVKAKKGTFIFLSDRIYIQCTDIINEKTSL